MTNQKLVFPGDYLFSCEEIESGDNTYVNNDDIFSAVVGENEISSGKISVKKDRHFTQPKVGMEVYCIVIKTMPMKAIAVCIPIKQAEVLGSSMEFTSVLHVRELGKKGFVEDLRHEVKIGDIIRAQIVGLSETDIDISIKGPQYGFLAVFCPRCRKRMDLKGAVFICSTCEWKENRKIPAEEYTS
ncbi:exosome complex RNA-binding protein Csl4 [Candidatus Micrarchaeota archaeon]|nr:exosome complex RNA-binding protein Csl4 [Candidatus Micrarchaeota archaeon]MBU1165519.1 exosome complex RNA-binding protein Csl4 [Candidatus Micrarchaeota archaeon]MBU1887417.1 exosome complex RNA-binding protein Csl4 [Candidatus Micrarchaeota archaeon]